jgi:hypothetical protein
MTEGFGRIIFAFPLFTTICCLWPINRPIWKNSGNDMGIHYLLLNYWIILWYCILIFLSFWLKLLNGTEIENSNSRNHIYPAI